MRISCWCLLVSFICLTSCQPTIPTKVASPTTPFSKLVEPVLWSLQIQVAEMKSKKGRWTESQIDFIQTYGDTARAIIENFEILEFNNQPDTLTIRYLLKAPMPGKEFQMKFANQEKAKDSVKYLINTEIQLKDNYKPYKPNEGKLTFFTLNEEVFVLHEFAMGVGKTKFSIAKP